MFTPRGRGVWERAREKKGGEGGRRVEALIKQARLCASLQPYPLFLFRHGLWGCKERREGGRKRRGRGVGRGAATSADGLTGRRTRTSAMQRKRTLAGAFLLEMPARLAKCAAGVQYGGLECAPGPQLSLNAAARRARTGARVRDGALIMALVP